MKEVVAGQPFLDIRFARSMRFEVRQGKDLRSLVIAFASEAEPAPVTRLPETAPEAPPSEDYAGGVPIRDRAARRTGSGNDGRRTARDDRRGTRPRGGDLHEGPIAARE